MIEKLETRPHHRQSLQGRNTPQSRQLRPRPVHQSRLHHLHPSATVSNNCYFYEEYAICGTRGWFFEEERSGQHDEKVFKRELIRLEASLKAAGDRQKYVFLHYPPRYRGYECKEILELLTKYEVRRCFYGHLHGGSHKLAMEGQWDGVEFRLVAADYIGFRPYTVIY